MTNLLKPVMMVMLLISAPALALAQSTDATTETATDDTAQTEAQDLLTQAELEVLVGPVALYPDTLLIQILVAATYPLQIVKSDRFLTQNADLEPEALQAAIEAEEWDPSVAVLATAFPDVTADMATNIEWTETMGDAMSAQSDDVMVAVQTMRTQAINTGALISGDAQSVEVTQDETVIIQPTDPQVVYVPQYDTRVVYEDNHNDINDALVTGLLIFGTFALIDNIFDNNNDWNNYWGCRNCGGWGGGPIIRNPDIDINVDGNVNIGNKVNIGNRNDMRPDGGWKPDAGKKQNATDKIAKRRDVDGKTKMPINKPASRGDDLRKQLSSKSGAADISRPDAKNKPQVNRPSSRSGSTKKAAAARTSAKPKAASSAARKKPAVKKPSARKAAPKKSTARKAAPRKKPSATKKRSSPNKARAGSNRGRSSGGKQRARR